MDIETREEFTLRWTVTRPDGTSKEHSCQTSFASVDSAIRLGKDIELWDTSNWHISNIRLVKTTVITSTQETETVITSPEEGILNV